MWGTKQTRRQVLRGGFLLASGGVIWEWLKSTSSQDFGASNETDAVGVGVPSTPPARRNLSVAPVEEIAVTDKPSIETPPAHLPAEAGAIFSVDVSSMLADEQVRRLINASLVDRTEDADQVAELVTDPDEPTNLTAVSDVIGFVDYSAEEVDAGMIVNADASVDSVRDFLDAVPAERKTYRGVDLVGIESDQVETNVSERVSVTPIGSVRTPTVTPPERPDHLWVASVDAGRYAVGTESAVTQFVDVAKGAPSLEGTATAEAFDDTDGFVRLAGNIESDQLPSRETLGELYPFISRTDRFAGSLDRDGRDMVARGTATMRKSAHADSLQDVLNSTRQDVGLSYTVAADGRDLSVTVTRSVDQLVRDIQPDSPREF